MQLTLNNIALSNEILNKDDLFEFINSFKFNNKNIDKIANVLFKNFQNIINNQITIFKQREFESINRKEFRYIEIALPEKINDYQDLCQSSCQFIKKKEINLKLNQLYFTFKENLPTIFKINNLVLEKIQKRYALKSDSDLKNSGENINKLIIQKNKELNNFVADNIFTRIKNLFLIAFNKLKNNINTKQLKMILQNSKIEIIRLAKFKTPGGRVFKKINLYINKNYKNHKFC